MVFTSIPVYLDPPNRQQQPNQQQGAGGENPQLPPPPPPPGTGVAALEQSGLARWLNELDWLRFHNLRQPLNVRDVNQQILNLCYFNNYSLTQPRHFCKTCRRYWTRGGALRSVPGTWSSTTTIANLPPLNHLSDYNSTDIGLNFVGIQPTGAATVLVVVLVWSFRLEVPVQVVLVGLLSSALVDQWRLQQVQQFPFLANFEPPTGLYPYEGEGFQPPNYVGQLRSRPLDSGVTQLASVKMEENQGLNLSKNFLGMSGNEQYWGGNAWTDLPGFTSSSTSHLL
ncbi:hypothetical protein GH714_010542 [Hevea brasiliensis]|uniref:Dof zinc finger protein n=1 Tax=Hevea brasiliensis TaxID=3981 RepID=A0A6A6N1N6_HEVBR|nr:hypothetical protein GH714_010542 [Hevea brasiliensis]